MIRKKYHHNDYIIVFGDIIYCQGQCWSNENGANPFVNFGQTNIHPLWNIMFTADVIKIALRYHINSFNSNRFEKLLAIEDVAYDRMVIFTIQELPQYIREALCVRYSYYLDKMTKDYLKDVLPRAYIKRNAPLIAFVPIIERLNNVYNS